MKDSQHLPIPADEAEAVARDPHSVQRKWGAALGGGFVVLPTVLLHQQTTLGLDCEEMVLLANIVSHWWDADRPAYPRTDLLAKRTGLSRRTVQRRLQSLEEKGLLTKVAREAVTESRVVLAPLLDISGLVKALAEPGTKAAEMKEKVKLKKSRAATPDSPVQPSA